MPENNEMSRVSQKKNQKKNVNRKKKQPRKSLFKKIFLWGLALMVLVLVAGAGLFFYYVQDSPEITMDDLIDNESTVVLAANGDEIHSTGAQERDLVEANEIPQVLVDAVLSIEDQRFYNHIGVDPIRIAGAVMANITDGFASEGGSTITQQLVKLSVFSTKAEDQTLERKAQEAWLSLQLEQKLSKEQILTLYINKVYMSDNQYGMGTASEYYYGKPISEVELHEAALLAGMSQSPNSYNPYTNPEQAQKRRDTVLYMMYDNGKISEEQKNNAQEISVMDSLVEQSTDNDNQDISHIIDSYLMEVYEEVEEKTGLDPITAGLTIHTNLDLEAQKEVYNVLDSDESGIFPNDEIQTAVTVVDVHTGQLKAIGGNRKANTQLAFNHANETKNIGSTIKPLTTYGPAIEYLKYSTYHQVVDEATTFANGTPFYNWDRNYEGQISMRRALVNSRNVPTFKIYQDVGKEKVEEFLANVGLPNYGGDDGAVESASFNGFISPIDLAGSYAPFANGGQYTEPYTVSKVVTADGEDIDLTPSTTQAMSDYTAYMVTDMLKDAASTGTTGDLVSIPGVPQAGKTGTGNYTDKEKADHNIPDDVVPDSAYVGYTSNYSVSVWTGYANKFEEGNWLSNEDETRQIPRKVYREVMAHLSESVDNSDWSMPSSVVEVGVIKGSKPASLPSSSTPSSDIVKELFVKGTQPNAVTKQYQEEVKEEKEEKKETLPAPTGLSASYDAEANEINISWDAYSIENEDGEASYAITVGGQTATTGDTSYVVQNPSEGSVEISLTASVGDQTSPAASVQVTVPSSEEESEESESSESSSEESSEPESSESSSSSEESSEESSSEESSEESSSSESESSSSSSSSSSEEPSDETENNEN